MRLPSRRLAPGAGTARPPFLGRQGAAPGDQRPPPTPPPPSPSGPRADGGRPKRRRPRTPPEEAAAPGVRGHCVRGKRPHAPTLPAADRRRTGTAQDGANGAAPSAAGLGKAGSRTRAGGLPPPPPPPCRTDPLAADRQPPRHEYTLGGHAGDNGWQANTRWDEGVGGGSAAPPPPPPPAPPTKFEGHRSDPPPPWSRGDAPPPPEGTATRGGGMRLDLHTARPSAPSRLLPRGSRLTGEPTPVRRSGARTKPGCGAPEQYGGRAPHDPPHDHCPLKGGRAGVQV